MSRPPRSNSNNQYDPGLIIKEVTDFDGQFVRTSDVRSVVPEYYSHFKANYDTDDNPISVYYYNGTKPSYTKIGVLGDVAGSLNSTYFELRSAPSNDLFHVWYSVDGAGVDPAPLNSTGIKVDINTGDSSLIVATATVITINSLFSNDFYASRVNSYVEIKTIGYGLVNNSVDVDTGFSIVNTPGEQKLVSQIEIEYNGNDPIYNGQLLKGYKFDIFNGKFENTEQMSIQGTVDVNVLNSLIDVPYDDLEITQFTANGDPEIIEIRESGDLKRTLTLTYNADGDFQRVQRT